MCSGRGSGPRLVASIRIAMSSVVDLGVLDVDVEVAVLVEDPGVEQLVLGVERRPPGVLLDRAARRGTRAGGTCRGYLM